MTLKKSSFKYKLIPLKELMTSHKSFVVDNNEKQCEIVKDFFGEVFESIKNGNVVEIQNASFGDNSRIYLARVPYAKGTKNITTKQAFEGRVVVKHDNIFKAKFRENNGGEIEEMTPVRKDSKSLRKKLNSFSEEVLDNLIDRR